MAKVSLRIYNRDIETMVDRGQLEEAIAHCRHILNTFPKNLETYRLLGKAYLEARRYEDATDIFERLLMAVPDDFVAHVGMSIIRDEQNDLDAAIWHMQRAFEIQPSNAAIQGELQRLFGRRDGVEPPKIRLTRGALAHMYVQGELYPQAISEIKAVMEEDRERQDMQVLLALANYQAGQKNEAAEICAQLLRRYPYCFDANRILVELLPETERGESTQVYRQRVNELDPYATYTTLSIFHPEEVPDAAVSLERLEWNGQPVELGQEWRDSLGIGRTEGTPARDEEPDWLTADYTAGSFNASLPTEEPASASSSDNEIPDFLREAGWGRDTGTFKEAPGSFEASGETTEEAELAEGDLPDWIKAMAPTGANLPGATSQNEPEEDLTGDSVPDWLQGLGNVQDSSSEEQPLEQGDLPDWLADLKPESKATHEPQHEDELMAKPAGGEDLPDWIADMKPAEEAPQQPQPAEESMAEPAGEEELPDWFESIKPTEEAAQEPPVAEDMQAEPVDEAELPDWLKSMKPGEEETPQLTEVAEEMMAEPASEEGLPDWLESIKPGEETQQEPPATEEIMAEPAGEEELPDWITGLKPESESPQMEAEQAAEPVQAEELPDWLQSLQREEEKAVSLDATEELSEEPVQEFPEVSSESLSDWQLGDEELAGAVDFDATDTGTLGKSVDEQDDAIAWLEGLAAKHGAKPEELVTKPEERTETEPEWVRQARAVKEQEGAEPPAIEEEPEAALSQDLPGFPTEEELIQAPGPEVPAVDEGASIPSAQEQDDAIAWLESLAAKHGAKPEELVTDPNARKETAPEWVQKAAETGATQPPAEELATSQEPIESGTEWVEPSKEEPGEPVAELEDTQPNKPLSRAKVDETGIWLRNLEEEAGLVSEQEPTAEAETPETGIDEELPGWLREIEAESAKVEAGPTSEQDTDVPDWLSELSQAEAEASLPEEGPLTGDEPEEVPDWLLGVESESPSTEQYPVFPSAEEPFAETGTEVESEAQEAPAESKESSLTDWLKSIETEDSGVEADETIIAETESEGLPSWLEDLEEKPAEPEAVAGAEEELPEWLRGVEEQEPVQAELTTSTDWQPVEEEPSESAVEPAAEVEEPSMEAAPEALPEPEAEPQLPQPEQEAFIEPPEPPAGSADMVTMLSPTRDPILGQAQTELASGNISGALDDYDKLIRRGEMLDEIIHDLREALYRYPVDVSILQSLGDAYMRANRLQDALDSYTKAEELLR